MPRIIQPNWPAPHNVKALTTTRELGCMKFEREKLAQITNKKPEWLTQIHGATAIELPCDSIEPEADASYTRQPDVVCAVITADCLPILITNKSGTEVAAIHAGWRGLLNGVIEQTLAKLKSPPKETISWLGPAIGPAVFELNEDILVDFLNKDPQNRAAFSEKNGQLLADIYQLAKISLNTCGVHEVYGGDYCTYRQENLFYSSRRDHGNTGRMATLIWFEAI